MFSECLTRHLGEGQNLGATSRLEEELVGNRVVAISLESPSVARGLDYTMDSVTGTRAACSSVMGTEPLLGSLWRLK